MTNRKKIKVLHIETGMHLYGGAKQVTYLLEGLNTEAVNNILCVPKGSQTESWARDNNIKVRTTDTAGDLDLNFFRQVKSIMRDENPDLVHLHSRRGADVLGGLAAKLENIPCVLSRRVDNVEKAWIIKFKYGLYNHVISISEGIKRVLLSQGVPANKITCVHSAVDASHYQNPASREDFLNEFGLPKDMLCSDAFCGDAFYIGVVAQLIQRKGHRYLLQVLPELIDKNPQLQVLIFGKGPLSDSLKEQVDKSGLQQHITFTGFRNDLEKWLGCLDLIVHPADIEGLGVSLLQAAAAGVPIVASRAGGMPEIVHHEENGLLIEPGDTTALSRAIQRIIDDEKLRTSMQLAGPILVDNHFSLSNMVQGNLQIYHQVLSGTI